MHLFHIRNGKLQGWFGYQIHWSLKTMQPSLFLSFHFFPAILEWDRRERERGSFLKRGSLLLISASLMNGWAKWGFLDRMKKNIPFLSNNKTQLEKNTTVLWKCQIPLFLYSFFIFKVKGLSFCLLSGCGVHLILQMSVFWYGTQKKKDDWPEWCLGWCDDFFGSEIAVCENISSLFVANLVNSFIHLFLHVVPKVWCIVGTSTGVNSEL